jgi:hypothetical protein
VLNFKLSDSVRGEPRRTMNVVFTQPVVGVTAKRFVISNEVRDLIKTELLSIVGFKYEPGCVSTYCAFQPRSSGVKREYLSISSLTNLFRSAVAVRRSTL